MESEGILSRHEPTTGLDSEPQDYSLQPAVYFNISSYLCLGLQSVLSTSCFRPKFSLYLSLLMHAVRPA
jgi:hypothetical protein